MAETVTAQTGISAPPSFDLDSYLLKLNLPSLQYSAEYRRLVSKFDPLLFHLIYFGERQLTSPETGPGINLAQVHIDLARGAERWSRNDLGFGELREAWIVSRGGAKSTSTWNNAVWALAFGHRRFITAFCANNYQAADMHMANLQKEFEENTLLVNDFPELCTPKRKTANRWEAKSGAVITAHGIDSTQLGAKSGNRRPDLLLFDDIEPDEGNYSPHQKMQRQSTMINGVLAMNPNAVVQLCGTVTMFGSLAHDLARAAVGEWDQDNKWVREQNIRTRYYPPIVINDEGVEESFWEARYPLSYLKGLEGTRYYELNFLNMPRASADGLFVPADFVVREPTQILERVMWIDPAVTTKATSDETGIAVVGLGPSRNVWVEDAFGVRAKADELRDLAANMTWANRSILLVKVETNQGGDVVVDALRPVLPPGVEIEAVHTSESKDARIWRLHDYYKLGWLYHADELPELRHQLLRWPRVKHDDVADAVSGAADHFLKDRPRARMLTAS